MENLQHAWQTGIKSAEDLARGDALIMSRFTPADALSIRLRRAGGEPCKSLAKEYGVTSAWISAIVKGQRLQNAGGPLTHRKDDYLLTDEAVRRIRHLVHTKAVTQKVIARQFNLDQSDVSRIAARKRYGHVA